MKKPLRKTLFRSAAGLVFLVLVTQLALFALYEVWEFQLLKQSGDATLPLRDYMAAELEELFVLGIIGVLTLPWILLFCWYAVRRTLSPLEKIAMEVQPMGDQDVDHRICEYSHDDEIGVLVRAVNDALDRYRMLLEKQRNFADNVSHELRTPLAVIQAEVDLAVSRTRSVSEYQSSLQNIRAETEGLLDTLEQLLFLARLKPAPQSVEPVDLHHLTAELFEREKAVMHDKTVLIENRISLREVESMPAVLGLIFSNLIRNALHIVPEGGTIRVEAGKEDDGFFWTLFDSGPGFDEKDVQTLFSRHQRGTGSPYPGEGLGLSIAEEAVHILRGEILFDRQDPLTAVTVRIPYQLRSEPEGS